MAALLAEIALDGAQVHALFVEIALDGAQVHALIAGTYQGAQA
jgi:hypothetical protein